MKRIAFFILFSLLFVISAFSQTDLQTIAVVNLTRSEPITVRQLRTEVERMEKAAGRTITRDERRQILETMINERLVLQAAERDRIVVTDNEINQQVQQFRNSMAQEIGRQPTDAEFNQAVINNFGEAQAFRDQIRKQVISQKYLMSKKGTLINSAKAPTEQEIAAEYTLRRATLLRPATVRFSMIQIPYGPDAASRTRAKELADRLVREIASNPTKFDEAAARSAAPNSGYAGGDAGFLPRSQEARNFFGQIFLDTAFNLRQGQVSQLIESNQGFCIIKVTENYAEKILELDDIIEPGTSWTVRTAISQGLLGQRQQAVLIQATEELVTELRAGKSFQIMENYLNW